MKKTIVYTIIGMVSPAASLLLLPIYLKYLSTNEFAILSISNSFINVFSVLLSLKVDQALRTIHFYYADNPSKQIQLFRNLFSLQLFSFLTWSVILYFFGGALFDLIYNHKIPFYPYTYIVLIAYFFSTLNNFYFIFLQNKLEIPKYSFFYVLSILLTHVLQLSCVFWFKLGFMGYLYSGLIANLFVFLLIFCSNYSLFKIEFSKTILKEALRFSIPFIPFLILYNIENQLDKFFLVKYLTLEELARYTVLLNVAAIVVILLNSLDNAIRPELYAALSNKNEIGEIKIKNKLEFYLIVGLVSLSFLVAFGTNIHLFLNQPKYNGIGIYFSWIVLAYIPLLLLRFLALLLIFENKTKLINYFSTLKIVLMCLLFMALIPILQIKGAIITVGISSLLNTIVFYKILDTKVVISKKVIAFFIFFIAINCTLIIINNTKIVSFVAILQFAFFVLMILYQYWSTILYQFRNFNTALHED